MNLSHLGLEEPDKDLLEKLRKIPIERRLEYYPDPFKYYLGNYLQEQSENETDEIRKLFLEILEENPNLMFRLLYNSQKEYTFACDECHLDYLNLQECLNYPNPQIRLSSSFYMTLVLMNEELRDTILLIPKLEKNVTQYISRLELEKFYLQDKEEIIKIEGKIDNIKGSFEWTWKEDVIDKTIALCEIVDSLSNYLLENKLIEWGDMEYDDKF